MVGRLGRQTCEQLLQGMVVNAMVGEMLKVLRMEKECLDLAWDCQGYQMEPLLS